MLTALVDALVSALALLGAGALAVVFGMIWREG